MKQESLEERLTKLVMHMLTWRARQKRKIVNPDKSDLVVYYPGAGLDILRPLYETDGRRLIFVDDAKNW